MINNQFAKDVDAGLSTFPKKLSSKYFYDDAGDKIFSEDNGNAQLLRHQGRVSGP